MIRVGFVSSEGGCLHYRAELPARVIGLHAEIEARWGNDLTVNTEGDAPIGLYDPSEPDQDWIPHVIVLAGGLPTGLGADVINRARASGQRVVCDCDDWPWLPESNPHHIANGGNLKLGALLAADAVTCSTPTIKGKLAEHGIDATMIRNTIEPGRYRDERAHNLERLAGADAPEFVVGYRGLLAGFHDADLAILGGLLPTENVRYVHVGADPRSEHNLADLTGIPQPLVEERPAVAFDDYGPALAGIDLALIPLADRPFSAAKSAIAALEWHAAGVPWLASDHPEFARIAEGAGIIWTARAWSRMIELLADPAARRSLFEQQVPRAEPFGERWARVVLSTMTVHA